MRFQSPHKTYNCFVTVPVPLHSDHKAVIRQVESYLNSCYPEYVRRVKRGLKEIFPEDADFLKCFFIVEKYFDPKRLHSADLLNLHPIVDVVAEEVIKAVLPFGPLVFAFFEMLFFVFQGFPIVDRILPFLMHLLVGVLPFSVRIPIHYIYNATMPNFQGRLRVGIQHRTSPHLRDRIWYYFAHIYNYHYLPMDYRHLFAAIFVHVTVFFAFPEYAISHYIQVACIFVVLRYVGAFREELFKTFLEPMLFPGTFFGLAEMVLYLRNGVTLLFRIPALSVHVMTDFLPYHESVFLHVTFNDLALIVSYLGFHIAFLYQYVIFWIWLRYPVMKQIFLAKVRFALSKVFRDKILVFDRKELIVQLLEDLVVHVAWFLNPGVAITIVLWKTIFKVVYSAFSDKSDFIINYVFSELMVTFYFTLPAPLAVFWHFLYNRCCQIQEKPHFCMNILVNFRSGFSIEKLYDQFISARDTKEVEALSKLLSVVNAICKQDVAALALYSMDRSYDFYCKSLLEYFVGSDGPVHNAFTGTKLMEDIVKVVKSFYYSKFLGEFEFLKPVVNSVKKLQALLDLNDIGSSLLSIMSEIHKGVMGYVDGAGFIASLSPSKEVIRRKIKLEIINLEHNEPTIEELEELTKRVAREIASMCELPSLSKEDKEYYDFLVKTHQELYAKSENLRKRRNPMPVWLIGPSGTGKTEAVSAITNMLLTVSNAINKRSDHAGQVLPIFLNNKHIAETKKSNHVRAVQVNDIDSDHTKADEQGKTSLGTFSQMIHDSFPFNFPSASLHFKTMLENDIEVVTYTSNHSSFIDTTDMEKNVRRYASGVMAKQYVVVDDVKLNASEIAALSEEKRNACTEYVLLTCHASRNRLWFKETDVKFNQVDFMKYVSDRFGVHLDRNRIDSLRVENTCACGLADNYHWVKDGEGYRKIKLFPACDSAPGESDTAIRYSRTVGKDEGTKELFERPEVFRPDYRYSPAALLNELREYIGVNLDGRVTVATSATQAEKRISRHEYLTHLRERITDPTVFYEPEKHLRLIRYHARRLLNARNARRLAPGPVHNAGHDDIEPVPSNNQLPDGHVPTPTLPFYLEDVASNWSEQRSAWGLLLTSDGFMVLCGSLFGFTVLFCLYGWCWYNNFFSTSLFHVFVLLLYGPQLQWFLWNPWWNVLCFLYEKGYLTDELIAGVGFMFAGVVGATVRRKLSKLKKFLLVVSPIIALYAYNRLPKSGGESEGFVPRTRNRTRRPRLSEPVHNGFANKMNTDEDTMVTQVEQQEVYPRSETKRHEWGRATHVNTVTMGLVRTDPEGLRKSINAQVREFRTDSGLKANALILNSNLIVMNRHAFEDRESVNFHFKDGIKLYLDLEEDCNYAKYDDYVFTFNPYAAYFSDLSRFFFDEVPSFSLDAKPYLEDEYFNCDVARLSMVDKGRSYDHNVFVAPVKTEMGDCGKPWVAKTTNGPAIVGIQCVKWEEHSGCTPLSQEIIRRATEQLGLHIYPVAIFLNTLDTVMSRIRGPVPDNSSYTEVSSPFIKVLGTEGKPGAKFKSDFQYTPFRELEDEFSKPQGIPFCTSSTTDGVYTSAFLKTFENINNQGKVTLRFRRFVADLQLQSFDIPSDWRRSPLSLSEAFFGDKRQGVERLDFNTSLGVNPLYDGNAYVDSYLEYINANPVRYALLLREKGYKNKHQLFTELDSGTFVFSNEVREDVDELIGMLKRGIVPPIAEYVHKDEIRAEEKVRKGHVRLFGNVDFRFNIVMRMYLMPLIATLSCTAMRSKVRMACGINATSYEWDDMICLMKDSLDKWFGMDYKCYDTTHDKVVIYFLAYFWGELAKKLGYSDTNVTIVRNIIVSLSLMLVLYKGDWAIVSKRMISGIIATLLNNDLLNDNNQIGYFIYRSHIVPELSLCTLFEDIVYRTMGDDLLGGVTDFLLETDPHYLECMAPGFLMLFGATITDDTKTADYIHTVEEKDVSFLKRRIVFNVEMNQYVAPLEWDSIIKSLVYEPKKAQPSTYERMGQAWHQAQREACLHGEAELKRLQDRVFAINESLPVARRYNNLSRVDYGSYINEYVDKRFREEGYATF